MTASQRQWLISQGLNPVEYDVTPDGQVVSSGQAKEEISAPKAFGASFLKSLLPSAAGLASGAYLGGAGGTAFGPVGSLVGAIGGGLAGGYGVGKAQDAVVDKFAPSAAEYLRNAEEQHPVASYLGGFAPNALAMKPSLSGLRGLASPVMSTGARNPAFMNAAANVGANVAGSTAGQLVNVANGGEFSPGHFAADVALGSLFNDPYKATGGRLGLHSNPAAPAAEKFNLHESQVNQAFDQALASGERSVPEKAPEATVVEEPREIYTNDPDKYTKWWTKNAAPDERLIADAAKSVKMKLSKERIAEIANEPYAQEIMAGNYENWPDFLAYQADKAMEAAYNDPRVVATSGEEAKPGTGVEERFEDLSERYPVLSAEEAAGKRFDLTPERQNALDDIRNKQSYRKLRQSVDQANLDAEGKSRTGRAIEGEQAQNEASYEKLRLEVEQANASADEAARVVAENERVAAAESTRKAAFRKTADENELGAIIGAQRERAANLRSIAEGKTAELRRLTQMSRPRLDAPVGRELAPQNDVQLGRENWLKASPEDQAAVAKNARKLDEQYQAVEADKQAKLPDLEAAQALVDEAADHRASAELRQEELEQLAKKLRLPRAMMDDVVSGRSTLEEAYKAEATAREIRDELYTRFQNKSDGTPLTQEALDAVAKIAAKRGLKIELGPISDANGMWSRDKAGNVVMRLDPLHARIDTAVEELSHDVFNRSATKRMQKSLTEAMQDSDAYKSELARRAKDVEEGRITQEKADDIAREEGFIAAFRQKYPNVPAANIVSWWKAFKASMKSMAGMKMSPEDAMSWMYYATHEHTPWSAHAANGVAATGDRRNQPRDPLSPELEQLYKKGLPHALAADGYKASYNTRDAYLGSLRERFNEVNKLSPEDRLKLDAHMQREMDSRTLATPAPEIADAYNQLRKTFYPSVPADYTAAGFGIRTATGIKARGTDPTYSAEHTASDDIKRIFTTAEGMPERQRLHDDFIKHESRLYAADNPSKTAAEVLAYAEGKFAEEIKIMKGETGAEDAHFAGAIKPQGYPLPPSWRSTDILKKLDNYARRTSTDYAYQKHIESSPELMAALGSKTHKNGAPIPASILAAYQHQQVGLDPSMQSIIREFNGSPARPQDSTMTGVKQLVSAGAMGTVSRAKDTVGTTFKGLSYLQPTDYLQGTADFMGKLAEWGELKKRSYESGLNRRDASSQLKSVISSADELSNWMTRAADKLGKYTGLQGLESAARTIAQGWGETIVALTKNRAMSGDAKSIEFLDRLSKDWRSRTDADLAAQVGRLMQGTYDMRTLPAWALEGPAAPFLTWSKWSIGQYNNFKKFAIEPAMKGDVAPLISQMIIGVAGGSAVQAVADWMNNRENKDINWSELSSWIDQNHGELGKDGAELLGQKLLTLSQNLGTFGFAGDMAKTLVDSVSGGGGGGIGTMPVYDAVLDTGKRTAAALKAIDNGEDFGRVLRQLAVDLGKGHFQVARAASNWIDTDANLEYNDKRRRRLFDELSGEAAGGNTFAVSYDNLTERDLDRAAPEDVASIAGKLIERAATNSNSLEEFHAAIRKYKTAQNGVMPSPERDGRKAAAYLSWLEDSTPGAGVDASVRYESNKRMAAFRKAAIAQGSGVY